MELAERLEPRATNPSGGLTSLNEHHSRPGPLARLRTEISLSMRTRQSRQPPSRLPDSRHAQKPRAVLDALTEYY